jgi:hypothetical protein
MKNRNAVNNNQLTRVLGTLFQKLTNDKQDKEIQELRDEIRLLKQQIQQ